MTLEKQFQIQDIIKYHECDIVHLQESDIDSMTFENCSFINNNYTYITNNSRSKYGTASLVKNEFNVENIAFDTNGRLIVFNIGEMTFCNAYLEAGSDSISRASRENYCGETLPNLLINRGDVGCAGGDWNCIINKADAKNLPDSKMSPALSRLVRLRCFNWEDSHKKRHPNSGDFSHFYKKDDQVFATRLDRQYHWGKSKLLIVNIFHVPSLTILDL